MSIVFDEILTEINVPSTETVENDNPASGEESSDAAQTNRELLQTLERLKKRQLRVFAD
ncbi:MAG: hypothetical protein GY761_00225 [Hyphomicrobiales bacterium]|nr:hypothetical protein [Hyphomicrobiales bacterium]